MIPSSYTEAKATGAILYFTGSPCRRGHVANRYTKSCCCVDCIKENKKTEKSVAYRAQYLPAYAKSYYKKNKKNHDIRSRTWATENRVRANRISADWRRNHPEKWAEMQALHRANLAHATPAWVDRDSIKKFYDEARRITLETGVLHHVDHIYPIKSDWVCGLHVETNLRVIPAQENIRKRNFRTEIHT